jgi:hypothetical protein
MSAQASDACCREDCGVDRPVRDLLQARVDVAPEVDHLEIGSDLRKEGPASDARGADGCAGTQAAEPLFSRLSLRPDNHIVGRRARWNANDHAAFVKLRGQVLGRVNGEVRPVLDHFAFDLGHEDALATDCSERPGVLVPPRLDGTDLDLDSGTRSAKCLGNRLGLTKRELRTSAC